MWRAWLGGLGGALGIGALALLHKPQRDQEDPSCEYLSSLELEEGDSQLIHSATSNYNQITVRQHRNGWRTLDLGDKEFVHSTIKVRTEEGKAKSCPECLAPGYLRTMLAGLALHKEAPDVPDPFRALFIGLGGGALPSFLSYCYPLSKVDVVEIDEEIFGVAKRFLGFSEGPNVKVTVGDGERFVQQRSAGGADRYDFIFMDACSINYVPPNLSTVSFFGAVKNNLRGGVFVANFHESEVTSLAPFVSNMRKVFDQVYVVPVAERGNTILFAHQGQRLQKSEWMERASRLSKVKGIPFSLANSLTVTDNMSMSDVSKLVSEQN